MPTARELLEQADALMRRNRSRDLEPDIPELTEEVGLTDVSPVPLRRTRDSRSERTEPYISVNDVPELTDAIGEIEEVSIDPLPDADGEDSRWPEVNMGEASITGPVPDSVVVVPPALGTTVETTKDPTTTAAIPIAGDGIPDARSVSPTASPTVAPASAAAELDERLAHVVPEIRADKQPAIVEGTDAGLAEIPAESAFEQEFPGSEFTSAASAAVTPGLAASEPVILPAEAEFEQEFQPMEPSLAAHAAADSVPVIAPVADAGRPVIGDDARWATMAEDIRMQVLQRIDIFTDTALSGELSTRLQPIVDRASADLLETINRQVGQLLRAYVAEAIEREIEKWREGNP
jgi:hypothetical protein